MNNLDDLEDIRQRTIDALAHTAHKIEPESGSRYAIATRMQATQGTQITRSPGHPASASKIEAYSAHYSWSPPQFGGSRMGRRPAVSLVAVAATLFLVVATVNLLSSNRDSSPLEVGEPGVAGEVTGPPVTPQRFMGVTDRGQLVEVDVATGKVLVDRGRLVTDQNGAGDPPHFISRITVAWDGKIYVRECCEYGKKNGLIRVLDSDVPTVDHPAYASNDRLPLWARTLEPNRLEPRSGKFLAFTGAGDDGGVYLAPTDFSDTSRSFVKLPGRSFFQSEVLWLGDTRLISAPGIHPPSIEVFDFSSTDGSLTREPRMIDVSAQLPNRVDSLASGPGSTVLATSCTERTTPGPCSASLGVMFEGLGQGKFVAKPIDNVPAGLAFGQTAAGGRSAIGVDADGNVWSLTDGTDFAKIAEGFRSVTWIPDGVETPAVTGYRARATRRGRAKQGCHFAEASASATIDTNAARASRGT